MLTLFEEVSRCSAGLSRWQGGLAALALARGCLAFVSAGVRPAAALPLAGRSGGLGLLWWYSAVQG
jgi:hypothetical protein